MEQLAEAQLAHLWKVGPVAVVMFIVIIGMAWFIKRLLNEKNALQDKKDAEIEKLNGYIRETHVEMMGLAQEFTNAVNQNNTTQVKFSPKRKKTTL